MAVGAQRWRRATLGTVLGVQPGGSDGDPPAPSAEALLEALDGGETARWWTVEGATRAECGWSSDGAHRAVIRAVRAWRKAGGGDHRRPGAAAGGQTGGAGAGEAGAE